MNYQIRTLKDLDLSKFKHPIVLLRLDLNVPIKEEQIMDDTRIQSALPTIKYLLDNKCRLVLCSHLGRPEGTGFQQEYSLMPVGEYLSKLLNKEVILTNSYSKEGIKEIVSSLKENQLILLENLRFNSGEKKGNDSFAKNLIEHVDFYVNDAFGTCHRKHASIFQAPKLIDKEKRAAGFLVEKEVKFLLDTFKNPEPPVTVIFGGAKVSDKISIIKKFTEIANNMIIGGAMAYTFLKYQGYEVGKSRVEKDHLETVEEIISLSKKRNVNIYLPLDHICASDFSPNSQPITNEDINIKDDLMALDIGNKTIKQYQEIIKSSKVILWNGPMGVFEWENFEKGTKEIALTISQSNAITIVGGGDSVHAVKKFNISNLSHVSTGGGASMELLEGKELPGLQVLRKEEL